MDAVLYEGGFDAWLCAVSAVYEYRLRQPLIVRKDRFQGNLLGSVHEVAVAAQQSERVWRGLQKKLSPGAQQQLYYTFLSEQEGIENSMLYYVQHVFASTGSVETDFSHPAVLAITQTAKKVAREKHRMEAFVRFRKTGDDLFYAVVQPDFNVMPLLEQHFSSRYAAQQWVIFDSRRKFGIYFNGSSVENVTIQFSDAAQGGIPLEKLYAEDESLYQQLWQQYYSSVNIGARKNAKLQLQHMPRRYWRYLTELQ